MNSPTPSVRHYRPDIDGLRAIAVLSVIVFHLDKSLLPGGFIGVDVFFVISGYLITGNIVEELARGQFSIAGFYQRRIKRIAPVLLLIIAVTLIFTKLLMLPEDARTTAKSAVWSIFSLANVYFWLFQDTTYFAASSAEVPLLHLWSLGVEEQFYILWPLLLLWTHRTRYRRFILPVVGVMTVFSFGLASALSQHSNSFAYYMLPTRAGELLIGALLAMSRPSESKARFTAAISKAGPLGFTLVAGSLAFISEDLPFPGWLAAPPTIGAALIILSGHQHEGLTYRLLSIKPLVWIGLISYSAYLWHWPLLAFYRYGYGDIHLISGSILFGLTLSLASVSYLLVERPARRAKSRTLHVVLRQYAAPLVAVLTTALVFIYADRAGLSIYSKDHLVALDGVRTLTRPAYLLNWVCQMQRATERDLVDGRCVLGDTADNAPLAILWGDSNAAHYVGLLNSFAQEGRFRFRNISIGSCPPIFADPDIFVESRRTSDCRASIAAIRPAIERHPTIIISASWSSYENRSTGFLEAFFETARSLTRDGKTVIIIGKAPIISGYDRRCREKALTYPFLNCPLNTAPLSAGVIDINARLRRFAEETAGARYFDANEYLCPGGICSAYDAEGRPKYVDESHLTYSASLRLGQEILARRGLPPEFASLEARPESVRPTQVSSMPKVEGIRQEDPAAGQSPRESSQSPSIISTQTIVPK